MGAARAMTIILYLFFVYLFAITEQNVRQRRQISPEQPRMMTMNGHLIFQTGTNHNITFRSTGGGYVNIDGENVQQLATLVRSNKADIDHMKTSPTVAPSNLETRVANVEQRLNNLQPTGEVQNQLTTLSNRVNTLEINVPSNLLVRLTQIEQRLDSITSSGDLQTTLNDIRSRLTTLENNVSNLQGQISNGNSDVQRRVSDLEENVQSLQQLLTQNECNSNPCRNGGTCVDRYNGFFCQCPPAWKGAFCDVDVNECSEYAGTDLGCQNGATCVNTPGSFTCQCAANWYGIRCSERHDDCSQASHQELCGHGTCVNSDRVTPGQPKYTCICEDGWTTSGSSPMCVVDRDECSEPGPRCSADPSVPCINLPGSFTCGQCPAGFSGNGFSCVDINECEINNGGCSVNPRVDCTNTRGSRTCGPCPPGYQGNGVTCTWVGLCNINNGGCHSLATCQESPGIQGVVCSCPAGYVGNGQGSNGCVTQGVTDGPCASNPCRNGALCQNSGSTYSCVCQPGYEGNQCQTNTNECASNPCQNGGTCTDRVNGYTCACTSSYTGNNCEEETQSCGGVLTQETGTLTYPTQTGATYPHGVSCSWRIVSTPGKIISVTFTSFSVENHPGCAYDYLQVHDGPSATAHKIGTYCGYTLPPPINTTQHQMYIWFYSDQSISSDGFSLNWISADPVCGGLLNQGDHGTLSSPGYPGNYPHNRDCAWTVMVSPGMNIMFTFAVMALEHHDNCSYDYVEIRDGLDENAPLLQKYCSTQSPVPITTTNPYAHIRFHSDASLSDQGFLITYAAVSAGPQCGGQYTSSEGVVISPGFPSPYTHESECVWTITVPAGDTITLTFTTIDIEFESTCNYDFVEVRDGPNEMSPLFNKFCGSTLPSPLTSTGNTMFIRFSSDHSQTGQGFRATWTTACGGTYSEPEGSFSSPSYPNAYPANKECVYTINQSPGSVVTLSFTAFDLEGSTNCIYDYLTVYDGGSVQSPLLGRFCGAQIPAPVSSTQNMMTVKFVTDGSQHNTGFMASYTSSSAGCGGTLSEPTGTVTSPGHPNIYPHGVNCSWTMQASPGLVVRLTFHTFSIESNANCRYDYVELYDNYTASSNSLLGRYCGASLPPSITSSTNFMTVVFVSDESIAHEGFSAGYVTLNASTICGAELTDSTGVITSPNYPNNYPHERECVWTITAQDGNQILLNVTDFRLESHASCAYDFLEIRNGGFPSSPLVNTYCGTTIDTTIRSHSNRMYIRFKSDASQSARGFRISYDTTATGCGADLTNPTGSFVSPNYPNQYSHNAECFWTITISRGSRIHLTFVDFNFENHVNCLYDYVEIRDGSATGALLARYCGSQVPDIIDSLSNKLWIKFRSDMSVSGRGFHAFYTSICDTVLTDYSGVIESPNFPNPYPHNRNCTWVIQATLGNTLNVSFSHFQVETHTSCNYDHLQVRDGNLPTSPEIGTYCGNNIPPAISSSSEYLWLNFISDFSVASNGFRLEYITNGCGGYFTQSTNDFTSPNYPNPYPHRRVCVWRIEVATGQAIQLTIKDFDLETHSDCRFDVLEVYAGRDMSAPRLVQLCHKQTSEQVLTTTGNLMYVIFRSDVSINGKGFSASYKSIVGGCGGNFSTPTGTLMSKNFPENYPHNTDCEWLISVEASKRVVLTFQDFDVESSTNCTYDYVAVYDGTNANSTELMRHCGNSLPSPSIYRSSGQYMYVKMRSDVSLSGRGFKAQYVTGCGGILNGEDDGVITSPNYPNSYDMMSNCSWLIRADHSDDRITLTFTHMDIEEFSDCGKDYIRVLNGDDLNAPEVGTYCGRTIPTPITSSGSALMIQFVSDRSVQMSGFRALYTKSMSSCGAEITAQSGYIATPGYPNEYPHSTECVWTIRVTPGNRVGISFQTFNLMNHPSCNYDYVELREGDVHGRLIGRYCGTRFPGNLTAANGLWIKFRSDEYGSGTGFLAEFNTMYGGDLTGSSGQVASPNYPNQYPHNVNYVWTITVDIGMRIRVTVNALDIESVANCYFDYLRFLDGPDADGAEIGKFCGTTTPPPFLSPGNVIRVEFHSDFSSSGQGFMFQWAATSDQIPSTTPSPGTTTPVPGCGGNLGASNQDNVFTSPGYPSGYSNNLNCLWMITTLPGNRVWLNISTLDLEGHFTCSFDSITVYDNAFGTGRVLGRFCGREGNPAPLLSSTNYMSVRFQTDASVNATGFSINYRQACGGRMDMSQGVIASPNYPSPYPGNQNCEWVVQVTTGRTIEVAFNSSFNVVGSVGGCDGDYVMLLNGDNANAPPVGTSTNGRYCGNQSPATMETGSNRLYVKFVSDGAGSAVGFRLTFREVHVQCGESIRLTHDVPQAYIMSPNYPAAYPHNVDCVWTILVPATETVQVEFDENFNIETHQNCNFDYIEFRDGGTENSDLIGRYCGTSRPSTVKSTDNVMYARFRTDNSVPRAGFKALVHIARCGGTYIGQSGMIASPNFPSNYGNNENCEWNLRGPTGHFLTLTFLTFNLESSSSCNSADYLEIRDVNSTGPVLMTRCGSQVPQPILTSDSYAHVKFVSNNANTFPGFQIKFEASVEECGGEFTTSTGAFTSPNFPGQYAHNRLCTWLIRVPAGRRVSLMFNALNIEDHSRCVYDYVAVYNGILSDSPIIGRYCGDTPPPVVESSGNTMKVVFWTDGSVSNGGFSARYTSPNEQKCGGVLTRPIGNVTSPGYAVGNYTNNEQCLWLFRNQNQTSSSIFIVFNNLRLENHARCLFDFLEIKEGSTENGELIGRYCGNTTLPDPIISPSANLWMRFRTDVSIVDRGFALTYAYTDCGGVLTEDNGEILSPNFPNNYNHSDACAWLILAPEGAKIQVTFKNFSLENHPRCNFDYVDILNGRMVSSPSIGKKCGATVPQPFTSQSNGIRIIFKTDFSVAANGFRIQYQFVTDGCGGLFHDESGLISSPNYPSSYPHNTECVWDINVQEGYHVVLNFIPPFDMEAHGACGYDYVEVDDALRNGTLVNLGRWCSNQTPPPQKSTSSQMVVKFRSDPAINGNGFAANWTSGCGAIFTEDSGDFVSPGYPNQYGHNLMCNYTILAHPGRFIVFDFSRANFHLEGGVGCPYDYVQIYAGNDTTGRSLGKFCGTDAPDPVSSSGSMFIQFVTDRNQAFSGFRAQYRVTDCGGTYTEPYGTIRTPTYPTPYHNEANCTWLITVAENRVVDLKFSSFEVEAHPSCGYDYVEVRDGDSLSSPLMGRFCGRSVPDLLRSTGNSMVVNFVTDPTVVQGGFSAGYWTAYGERQGCGGVLNSTSGRFGSVDMDRDGVYEPQNCKWTIIVGDNKVVQLQFEGFDLEDHFNCRYDYVAVHDGMSEDDPLIGRYCGTQVPAPITSTSNVLYVRFVADYTVHKAGFNATYQQQDALCGGAFSASDSPQTISSPSYPRPVGQDLRCRWTIDSGDSNQQIRVSFTGLNLISDNNCSMEYIELRDSPLGWTGRSHLYCGTSLPPPFDSAGRTLQINYMVTSSSGSQGFSLRYQIANCNRTYTGTGGKIFSPGWPGNYPRNAYCEMSISAPAGTYVTLYFNSFYIEPHSTCRYDYLEIRNGSTSSSPLINQLCGNTIPNPIFATGNTLWMNLVTDSSIVHPGYDITWTASTSGMGCGGDIVGINGSITSPNYPGNYTERHSCRWLITAPARRVITAYVVNINILGSPDCNRAYVEIHNGYLDSSPSFGRYCGNEQPPPLRASGNKVLIKFVTDGFHTAPGFRLLYTS
ncbi:cubilin-like isoform X2 [Crassostrea angulata]|uniref:cubilin-like isoform X2 n=1 Tax=Magallana angulata TaxID=2784310 RepID=UPI0022B12DBB|nr:cubilin-like isoform X2 [Crassostrea angulata]